MWDSLTQLDRILRGEATQPEQIRDGRIDVPLGRLAGVVLILAMLYGACMGSYALLRLEGPSYLQLVASALKVPALFYLTLLVTLPSLYVFNALVGSRLTAWGVVQLLVTSLAVNIAVLASLGPIVAFFGVSTTSYSFMSVLNVAVFAVSGLLGVAFLSRTLARMTMPSQAAGRQADGPGQPPPAAESGRPPANPAALDRIEGQVLGRHGVVVFRCWIVLFGLVGAQMGWVLRPFIGDPNLPFEWLRERESNFFEAIVADLRDLLLP